MIRSPMEVEEPINGKAVVADARPDAAVRIVGALLALAVAAVHVADQGGVTAFGSPDWLGWAYRLVEVGGVLTAVVLLAPRASRLGWSAAVLLGVGPFLGYLVSRTVGVPGDSSDVGNWGYWVGTVSLFVEAALVVLAIGTLVAERQHSSSRTLRVLTAADLLGAKTHG